MTVLVPPDLIPNWIPGEKTVDSSHLDWSGLTLKGYRYPDMEANIPFMRDYMIVVYEGARAIMQRSSGGPWHAMPWKKESSRFLPVPNSRFGDGIARSG
jgi:AraC family transcriptional regulator